MLRMSKLINGNSREVLKQIIKWVISLIIMGQFFLGDKIGVGGLQLTI